VHYSSVRRADDGVAIIFVSDHGMTRLFAKTQLYHHSSRALV
jgi:hypothetical protein